MELLLRIHFILIFSLNLDLYGIVTIPITWRITDDKQLIAQTRH